MNYKDPSGNVAISLAAGLILERVVDTAIETFVDVLIDMVLEGESFCFGKSAVEGLLINIVPFAGEASTSKKLAKLSTKYGDDIVLALRNTDEIVKHADEIIEVAKKDGVKGLQRYLSTFGKGIKGTGETVVKSTLDYMDDITLKKGKYYAPKNVIDEIGQIEARGVDFSKLNSKIMSSRASTEGGLSQVIKYSDESGTRFLIHQVTDAAGKILHRDFDGVMIESGQMINKLMK